jgi:tetratricopeptide (TPR) repeat protein
MSENAHRTSTRRLRRKLAEIEGYLILNLPHRALEAIQAQPWPGLTYEASVLAGEALRQLGEPRAALLHLERAATLRPLSPDLAIALGWCYKRTHRLAQAIEALEAGRRRHPDEPLLAYNLACYWSLAGNPLQAVEQLAEALRRDPDLYRLIAGEPDFDAIRHHPAFLRLVQGPAASPEVA